MNRLKSALLQGLTVEASPTSTKGIEVELQNGGYDNPRLFPGFRAILRGTKQRYIGLADNGKTTLPAGCEITGLHLTDGAKLVRVRWDDYPASAFLFMVTPERQVIGIEPAAGVDLNVAPNSLQVRGFYNLTAVVTEGERFLQKLRGKAIEKMGAAKFRVVRYPKIEEGLRVMVPSLQFLSEKTVATATTLVEGKTRGPKPKQDVVSTSVHALVQLPQDALGERVTPRGYPKEWLTFAHLPVDDTAVVFLNMGDIRGNGEPMYAVHHLSTLISAASA